MNFTKINNVVFIFMQLLKEFDFLLNYVIVSKTELIQKLYQLLMQWKDQSSDNTQKTLININLFCIISMIIEKVQS